MEGYRVNWVRVERVAEVLGRLGLEGVLKVEERVDPQFDYVARVARRVGVGAAALSALLVGLASYRLAMRAEDWWGCFASLIPSLVESEGGGIEGVYRGVLRFLVECKGSVIGREGKVKRVRRAWAGARSFLENLYREPSIVFTGALELAEALRRALGEKDLSKTVVFSVKMAYYAARAWYGRRPLPRGIPMPVDVRVACTTYSSGMVDGPGYRGLVSKPRPAREAWGRVAELTGIPELHLDTIAWLAGWAPRDLPLERARAEVAALLADATGSKLALEIARELCTRPCIEAR